MPHTSAMCNEEKEGHWAVGLVSGPTPFSLSPHVDSVMVDGIQTPCPRNPIFMCSDVTDLEATFVVSINI